MIEIIDVTKEQAAWLRDHGIHVITLNKQHPSRAKGWVAPDDRFTRAELAHFEKRRRIQAEVMHGRKR